MTCKGSTEAKVCGSFSSLVPPARSLNCTTRRPSRLLVPLPWPPVPLSAKFLPTVSSCNRLGTSLVTLDLVTLDIHDVLVQVALVRQAEDRAHRQGTTKAVNVYFRVAKGTCDDSRCGGTRAWKHVLVGSN